MIVIIINLLILLNLSILMIIMILFPALYQLFIGYLVELYLVLCITTTYTSNRFRELDGFIEIK